VPTNLYELDKKKGQGIQRGVICLCHSKRASLGGPNRAQRERYPVYLIFEDCSDCAMLLWAAPHMCLRPLTESPQLHNLRTHLRLPQEVSIYMYQETSMSHLSVVNFTFGCFSETSSFTGRPAGLYILTSAPNLSSILHCTLNKALCRAHVHLRYLLEAYSVSCIMYVHQLQQQTLTLQIPLRAASSRRSFSMNRIEQGPSADVPFSALRSMT